jgi:hypothetical protein
MITDGTSSGIFGSAAPARPAPPGPGVIRAGVRARTVTGFTAVGPIPVLSAAARAGFFVSAKTLPASQPLRSIAMHRVLLRRLNGVGLLLLSLGPPAIFVVGLGLAAALVIDIVHVTRARVAAVAETVNDRITPRIADIRAGYETLAADAGRLDGELGATFRTLASLQDLRIAPGQFGTTAPQHVRIPDNDVWIGPLKIGSGQFADRDLPTITLPSQPISIPVTPLRDAFAPLGENGPVGQAIHAAQGALGHAVGTVADLRAPLDQVIGTIESGIAPLTRAFDRIALIGGIVVAALVTLLLAYGVAGVMFAVRRRAEAAAAYRTGGEIGYVLWVHRMMVLDGIARLRGRPAAVATAPSAQDLARKVAALQADLRDLRAMMEAQAARSPEFAA